MTAEESLDQGAQPPEGTSAAIGPTIRDVAARLGRIEAVLAQLAAPLGRTDDEPPTPPPPPDLSPVLTRLDEQAAAAERHDDAVAAALRDLVDQLNEFAGTVAAGAGAGAAPGTGVLSDSDSQRLVDDVVVPVQALEASVAGRLDALEALLAAAVAAPQAIEAEVTTVRDRLDALVLRPDPVPALAGRLDAVAAAVAALAGRPPPTASSTDDPTGASRPAQLDRDAVAAVVDDAAARSVGALRHQLDQLFAEVAAARTAAPHAELLERLDRIGATLHEVRTAPPSTVLERLDRLADAVHEARTPPAVTDGLQRLADGVAALRGAVPPPDPGPRLDEITRTLDELTARLDPLARLPAAVETGHGELATALTDVAAQLHRLDRLPATVERTRAELTHRLGGLGEVGATLGRLEARAIEQATLMAAVRETITALAHADRGDTAADGPTVVAALDALGGQLDAVGRVLQQLVTTLAVIEAGTIGVTPRAERSHAAAQAALAELRAVRHR